MKKFLKGHRFIFIALVVFLVLVTFVDKNNWLDNFRLNRKISALEEQRDFYLQRIREDSIVLENLQDPYFLEQYAREHFYMRRPDEEIFIIR